ncbi:N-acetyltransferase [Morganella morganii]|uniref:N-acetyltransferase n=1 Tax=Morganella morganii TaxID=582 RepID=A0A433ZYL6_MORMO|nr:GNAT family N-acetyltransferase [Morganella morganii]RUT67233.1 N-acetyltransferase [Morganella morganii]
MYQLQAKTIRLRFVEIDDAQFILSLRNDDNYNKYLSKTSTDIQQQKEWIKKYKIKEKNNIEYYFIIERNDGVPCGTVRVYDIKNESFCWGSWILNQEKTATAAIESALLVYKFGFEIKKYQHCHFEVVKGNDRVISFHKKFGAKETHHDDIHFYYEILPESINKIKEKYKKYL